MMKEKINMIGFLEALVKALGKDDKLNYYQEYENAFVFCNQDSADTVRVDKSTGEVNTTNADDKSILGDVVAAGLIEERVNEERPTFPTHDARYIFEHRVIPDLLYKNGIEFMASIVGEENILNEIFIDILEKSGIENPYGADAITIEPFKIQDIIVAKIIFPEPEEEPLCYESYALFHTDENRAGYFCLEKGETVDDEPFLCGWSEDGIHLNYDHCSFDRDELILNIFKIFMGYDGEDKPVLSATFTPSKKENSNRRN